MENLKTLSIASCVQRSWSQFTSGASQENVNLRVHVFYFSTAFRIACVLNEHNTTGYCLIIREVTFFFIQFLRLAKTTLDLKSANINTIRERDTEEVMMKQQNSGISKKGQEFSRKRFVNYDREKF